MGEKMVIVDGLQYTNWSEKIFKQMIEGGVKAVHATMVYHENTRETLTRFGEWNRRFEAYPDLIYPVKTREDILKCYNSDKVGIVLGAQNCSPIEDDIHLIEVMRDLGLVFMQLTYNNQSLLASGCYEENDAGISRFGRKAIKEMNRVGMIIDMSHSGERSTLEAIEISEKPIVISHANPKSFHESIRNKTDRELKALAESGGMIGFSLYPFHLKNGPKCTIEEFCQMVADTADLIGVDHIALGSDLCQDQPVEILEWMRTGRWSKDTDYGEGSKSNPSWPEDLSWFKDNRDFVNIQKALLDFGFDRNDVEKIMGLNWINFIHENI